jgi:hypothetical protein
MVVNDLHSDSDTDVPLPDRLVPEGTLSIYPPLTGGHSEHYSDWLLIYSSGNHRNTRFTVGRHFPTARSIF